MQTIVNQESIIDQRGRALGTLNAEIKRLELEISGHSNISIKIEQELNMKFGSIQVKLEGDLRASQAEVNSLKMQFSSLEIKLKQEHAALIALK